MAKSKVISKSAVGEETRESVRQYLQTFCLTAVNNTSLICVEAPCMDNDASTAEDDVIPHNGNWELHFCWIALLFMTRFCPKNFQEHNDINHNKRKSESICGRVKEFTIVWRAVQREDKSDTVQLESNDLQKCSQNTARDQEDGGNRRGPAVWPGYICCSWVLVLRVMFGPHPATNSRYNIHLNKEALADMMETSGPLKAVA